MSFTCKNDKSMDAMLNDTGVSDKKGFSVGNITIKLLAFSIFLILSPIIFLLLIWFGFKFLVVNQTIDIKPLISFLTKKIESETIDNDDYEEFDENDFVMVGVDDITNQKN
jgi:hypothetical protein